MWGIVLMVLLVAGLLIVGVALIAVVRARLVHAARVDAVRAQAAEHDRELRALRVSRAQRPAASPEDRG
jgi:hypothetical protein